ncbi:MAG TPA: hypothetical protein DCO77_08560 [Nitrospiraceae bacterium]|nr:hypothetical protein [Nitrospiraceae bacterium]
MKRMLQKVFLVAAAFVFSFALLSADALAAKKKIGILLWSEAGHYLEGREGIIEILTKKGFGNADITEKNAKGNKAAAAAIVEEFAAAKMDLVITLGTTATVIASKRITDIPIVFCLVFDPVKAKVAKSWKSSGNNTTGTSSMVSMYELVARTKELTPVKTMGVLYTPGQKNSVIQLKGVQAVQKKHRMKVVAIPIKTKKDVSVLLPRAIKRVDALYLSGSSTILAEIPAIVEIASKVKKVTVAHVGKTADKGVLIAVYGNARKNGRLAGEKAVKVLKGKKPSKIKIEPLSEFEISLNKKTAEKGGFTIPSSFMKKVTKVIE